MRFQNISHSTSAGICLDDYDREKSINREHSLLIPGQHCCSGSSQSHPHRAPNKTLTASPAPRLLRLNLGDSSLPTTLISQIASNGPLIIRLIKLDTAATEPLSFPCKVVEGGLSRTFLQGEIPSLPPQKKNRSHNMPQTTDRRKLATTTGAFLFAAGRELHSSQESQQPASASKDDFLSATFTRNYSTRLD